MLEDGTNWGKFGDRRFAGFAVLGWGRYWLGWSFIFRENSYLWNSWNIFNHCLIAGNCISMIQNSLLGKRDLCTRKKHFGYFLTFFLSLSFFGRNSSVL